MVSLSNHEGICLGATSLQIHGLTGIRGQRVLFRNLSVSLPAGEALSLEGPNGAGKTSLLRMIAGFLGPAAGTIAIGAVSEPEARGGLVGWLGHHDGAKPQLTPREVLAFYARLYGARADIAAGLDEVGLKPLADLPCQYLSAGQKRRLALARLKLSNRPLWLLDEPLAALDASGKAMAASFIGQHLSAGGLCLAATHEPLGIACGKLVLEGRA